MISARFSVEAKPTAPREGARMPCLSLSLSETGGGVPPMALWRRARGSLVAGGVSLIVSSRTPAEDRMCAYMTTNAEGGPASNAARARASSSAAPAPAPSSNTHGKD